jgi:predicted O-methyltransferase YrrM
MNNFENFKNIRNELMLKNESYMSNYLSFFNQSLGNASSLEQCVLLEHIIQNSDFEYILDTGAGISSFFIRKSKKTSQTIHTYETKIEWVNIVKKYLTMHELNSDHVFHVFDQNNKLKDEFINDSQKYDFIYHDMGCIEERIENLLYIERKLKKGGYIFLDDMHFGFNVNDECNLLKSTLEYFDNTGYEFIDIKDITLDGFGRFAHLYKKL